MKPNDFTYHTPNTNARSVDVPGRDAGAAVPQRGQHDRQAAADAARGQLDRIFSERGEGNQSTPAAQPVAQAHVAAQPSSSAQYRVPGVANQAAKKSTLPSMPSVAPGTAAKTTQQATTIPVSTKSTPANPAQYRAPRMPQAVTTKKSSSAFQSSRTNEAFLDFLVSPKQQQASQQRAHAAKPLPLSQAGDAQPADRAAKAAEAARRAASVATPAAEKPAPAVPAAHASSAAAKRAAQEDLLGVADEPRSKTPSFTDSLQQKAASFFTAVKRPAHEQAKPQQPRQSETAIPPQQATAPAPQQLASQPQPSTSQWSPNQAVRQQRPTTPPVKNSGTSTIQQSQQGTMSQQPKQPSVQPATAQPITAVNRPQSNTFRTPTGPTTRAGVTPQPGSGQQKTYASSAIPSQMVTQDAAEQWKQYHSAWQRYYQQYYQRYYVAQAQALAKQNEAAANKADEAAISPYDKEALQKSRDLAEIRKNIRDNIAKQAIKIRRSRHFLPIAAAVIVLMVFGFLQYNRVIFGTVAAYVSPGNIDPQNIIADPSTNTTVTDPATKLIIPKINVEAPINMDTNTDHNAQMKAMESGVARFAIPGANALPGQAGNFVVSGHSSNDAFAPGNYKFIFAQNEKLKEGDVIYVNYNKTRYTYTITKMQVVMPNEVNSVQIGHDKPMITLISCVPLGTADKRLLVFAEQVSPNPNNAQKASDTTKEAEGNGSNVPGAPAPTVFEKLFGAR